MEPSRETPTFYAILPATVRYDNRLKPMEKILYAEITALTQATGICTASNGYFARLYEVAVPTVSRWIKRLADFGYIGIRVVRDERNAVEKRELTLLTKKSIGSTQKDQYPIDEKINKNNTSINNSLSIGADGEKPRSRFQPPTVDQVAAYCAERGNKINPQQFVDFYESKGWMIGKNKMKSWQATVRTWEQRNNATRQQASTGRGSPRSELGNWLDDELAKEL